MAVMRVRVVLVRVGYRFVGMYVSVAHSGGNRLVVFVLVVFVMNVPVVVGDRLVGVLVFVTLREVQPDAERHENCRDN